MSDDLRSLRELIAALPVEQRAAFLAGLPVDVLAAATYEWAFWARPDQLEPSGPWLTWLMRSGRGAGKTRAGAEWVRAKAESGTYGLFNLVGRTDGDVRGTMVEGPSGLLTISPPHFRPIYRSRLHKCVFRRKPNTDSAPSRTLIPRQAGRGGLQETVHAKDQGDPAAQARGRALRTRRRPCRRRLELDGGGAPRPG